MGSHSLKVEFKNGVRLKPYLSKMKDNEKDRHSERVSNPIHDRYNSRFGDGVYPGSYVSDDKMGRISRIVLLLLIDLGLLFFAYLTIMNL